MKSILHPDFRYTPAAKTDIRKTIRREQKRLAEERARRDADAQEAAAKVRPLGRKAAA